MDEVGVSKARKPQGFAAMSPEKVAEISRLGGKAAHAAGTAHKFQAGSEKARMAGRKGAATRLARAGLKTSTQS